MVVLILAVADDDSGASEWPGLVNVEALVADPADRRFDIAVRQGWSVSGALAGQSGEG